MKRATSLALCVLTLVAPVAWGTSRFAGQVQSGKAKARDMDPGSTGNSRFFWVGSDGTETFTDEQLEYLVKTASSIVIAQFYAGFDIEAHHELARRVKALDPGVSIYGYMSGTYIKPRFDWMEGKFKDEWILRDRTGQKIVCKFQAGGDVGAYYADLTNVEYRTFLANTAADWMRIAPYDGIIFDACNIVNGGVKKTFLDMRPPHPREGTRFGELLSQPKMDALNDGLKDLLRETKAKLRPKLIVWNGFWRKKQAADRSLALLPLGDIALSERWSIGHQTDPRSEFHAVLSRAEILEDVAIVERGLAQGKMFFLKDTIDEEWHQNASPAAIERLARFGWGMYMLAHSPGRTSYGFSPGPRFSQNFHTDPVLLDVPAFGNPLGGVEELGDVLAREFEHGVVYLNATKLPVRVTVDRPATLLHGVGVPPSVQGGAVIVVPQRDAVILEH